MPKSQLERIIDRPFDASASRAAGTAASSSGGGGAITAHDLNDTGVHLGLLDWTQLSKTGSNLTDLATRAHSGLTGIGTNTHDQIDTHIATSDTHVAHSGVTLTAGNGLTGGGTIAANRTFAVNLATDPGLEFSSGAVRVKAYHGIGRTSNGIGVTLKNTSGLEVDGTGVALADSVAGAGLTVASKVLAVGAGTLITVAADSVGITAGANYQFIGTGAGTAAGWRNVSELAGAGLTATTGVLAVGAGAGITVNADDVALTTPGTLTATTSNSSTGNHTHAVTTGAASTLSIATSNAVGSSASLARADHLHTITTSSNPGAAASILASSVSGSLQLVTLASNATFTSGFAGAGYRVDYGITEAGKASAEFDNLTVRGRMRVYELLIQQIRATNGSVAISSSSRAEVVADDTAWTVNGDALEFNGTPATFDAGLYRIKTRVDDTDDARDLYHGFLTDDIIRAQRFDLTGGQFTEVRQVNLHVGTIHSLWEYTAVAVSGDAPEVGDELVRLGNATDTTRQGMVYLTADDSNAPYIDIVNDITSHADWNTPGKVKARYGRLSGITDSDFGGALSGYGLYAENAYLKGQIVVTGGNAATTDALNTGLAGRVPTGGAAADVNANVTTITGGKIRTGVIESTNWGVSAGSRYNLDDGTFQLGGSTSPRLEWDGTDLTVDGVIIAQSGIVGGWTIGDSKLTAGSSTNRVGLVTGADPAIYAGSETAASAPFRVTRAGALYAENATITGSITVTGGNAATTSSVTAAVAAESLLLTQRRVLAATGTFTVSSPGTLEWTGVSLINASGSTLNISSGSYTYTPGSFTGTVYFYTRNVNSGTTMYDTTSTGLLALDIATTGALVAIGTFVAGLTPQVQIVAGRTFVTGAGIVTESIVANNISANAITAVKIDANAVTADKILAGAVTASKISVTNLAAVQTNTGSLTVSGNITVGTSGAIYSSGKTSYNDPDAGFFLGYVSGPNVYRFGIGDSAEYLQWDGSNLEVAAREITVKRNGGAAKIVFVRPELTQSLELSYASGTTLNLTGGTLALTGVTATGTVTANALSSTTSVVGATAIFTGAITGSSGTIGGVNLSGNAMTATTITGDIVGGTTRVQGTQLQALTAGNIVGIVTAWTSLSANTGGGWANISGRGMKWAKAGEIVMFSGCVERSATSSTTIATLPVGTRPSVALDVPIYIQGAPTYRAGFVTINTDGTIALGNGGAFTLNNIDFLVINATWVAGA